MPVNFDSSDLPEFSYPFIAHHCVAMIFVHAF